MSEQCCGTCKWSQGSWNEWATCTYPLPYWVELARSVPDKVHREYDGQGCPTYEAKP